MVLIRKDLNYALHQIILSKLIFTVDDLFKVSRYSNLIIVHNKGKLVNGGKNELLNLL